MEVTLAAQSHGFLISCIVGFALGAFYDVFRILRILCRTEKRHVFFQDIFFMACAAVVTFLLTLAINWGELRFYILAGEIIGICIYYLTVGEVTVRIAKLIYKFLRCIFKLVKKWLVLPVVHLLSKIGKFFVQKFKNMLKNRKKISLNRKKPLKHHRKIVYNLFNSFCTGKGGTAGRRHYLRDESNQEKKAKK